MNNSYKFALIGYPLSHSLSPVIQKIAFETAGMTGTYEALETKEEDLINRIKFLKVNGYNGFNVTIPHKIPICLFLQEVDEAANRLGSVNTVSITEDKRLIGYNTDVYGFMKPLEKENLKNQKAVVLGTGGASRAVICGLFMLGVTKIDLYTRDLAKSKPAVDNLRLKFPELEIRLRQYEALANISDCAILINTTPLGMKNFKEGAMPLADSVLQTLDNSATVYDIVYNPIKTELIKRAEKFGKKICIGLDMLVFQGAKAFEIWTGCTPNTDKMKIAALEALL